MASDSPAVRLARTLEKLRRLKPASIIATDEDGHETKIAITGMRGRYERAARSLIAAEAVKCRLLDAEGGTLEVLNVLAAKKGPETDGSLPDGAYDVDEDERERRAAREEERRGAEVDDVRELVKISLDAAERARAADLAMFKESRASDAAMMKANTETLQTLTQAAVGLMATASERAERLEAMLVEMNASHRKELRALAMQLEAEREERLRLAAEAGDNSADKMIEKLIFGEKKPEEPSKPNGAAAPADETAAS